MSHFRNLESWANNNNKNVEPTIKIKGCTKNKFAKVVERAQENLADVLEENKDSIDNVEQYNPFDKRNKRRVKHLGVYKPKKVKGIVLEGLTQDLLLHTIGLFLNSWQDELDCDNINLIGYTQEQVDALLDDVAKLMAKYNKA